MKISDLRAGMEGVNVTGRVVKITEETEVETRFGKSRLAVAMLSDDTGSIRLNLWRWQANLVKVGDILIIENGFVRSFKGQLELNVGSRGKIITVSRTKHQQ
ncbi:MAG: OB-fold nucleic acid binding domain-containing protein [Candidatus Bathyarchaeia archaeon]